MNAELKRPKGQAKDTADLRRRRAAEGGKALRHSIKQAIKKAILPTKEDAGKFARGRKLGT